MLILVILKPSWSYPIVKTSKSEIYVRYHKLPKLKFDDQQLTSFSGLILFQVLFDRLNLKARLKQCCSHFTGSPIFSHHIIVLLLTVHLILGFRRLRDLDYYYDDPLVLRLLGLRKLPDVSTVSRTLSQLEGESVTKVQSLSSTLVLEGLKRADLSRVTMDFDGSVCSTTGHKEGSAIGFNRKKKGARSYYPLFCTVAQTGQFLDMHFRSGNVHDSNGAPGFMQSCFAQVRSVLPQAQLESRMDAAFFDQGILETLDEENVEFTATVPFERFPDLKAQIEARSHWYRIDDTWSYYELNWKPDSWDVSFRFLCLRQRIRNRIKGPLQLDLFVPLDHHFEYKVIVTNKRESAKAVLQFHNGRGSQEGIFAEAKQHAGLGVLPSRRLVGNQMVTLCAMMAHNLSREIQMVVHEPAKRALPKRPAIWTFLSLGTLRHRIIQRAGRLIRPHNELTLSMSANPAVRNELLHFLEHLQKAA